LKKTDPYSFYPFGFLKARLWTGFFYFENAAIETIKTNTVAVFIWFFGLKLFTFGGSNYSIYSRLKM